jgi:hypothetical protein
MIKKGLKMRMATENEKLKLAELLISEYGKNVTMKERIELLNHVSESNIVAYDLEGSKEYKTNDDWYVISNKRNRKTN